MVASAGCDVMCVHSVRIGSMSVGAGGGGVRIWGQVIKKLLLICVLSWSKVIAWLPSDPVKWVCSLGM